MTRSKDTLYTIPARYRKMENMHIVFWLIKDVSWCMVWKPVALVMIFPTLIISIIICLRTKKIKSEFAHNLAITFWITANSLWMVTEFFDFDTVPIWNVFEGKHLALIPFFAGIAVLANYYILQRQKVSEVVRVISE